MDNIENSILNNNINDTNYKKKSFIKLKNLKFKQERLDILKKIYDIIEINNNNKIFFSHELDNDDKKQKDIEALIEDIKKYFKTSSWICFNKNRHVDRLYISLIKYILKDMMIDFTSMSCKMKVKNVILNTTQYTINTPIDI